MRRWAGLDLNGWHDYAAIGPGPDDEDRRVRLIDGGAGSVVVVRPNADAVRTTSMIGGPQAILAPHGRGIGWGEVGAVHLRIPLRLTLASVPKNPTESESAAYRASIQALTQGAERRMLTIPDLTSYGEAERSRILSALGPLSQSSMLLWRPVAMVLAALEDGLLSADHVGSDVDLLVHTGEGIEHHRLRLDEAKGFNGLLAPKRVGYGSLTFPELGLQRMLDDAERQVGMFNPQLGEVKTEPTRLPIRWLAGEIDAGEIEILRRDNGDWIEVACPPMKKLAIAQLQDGPRGDGPTLLVTPAGASLARVLVDCLSVSFPKLMRLSADSIARGALIAGERVEAGKPHYLDELEPISLAVLRGAKAHFEPLIPPGSNVPANQEFISEPIRDFAWGAGKDMIEFHILKGDKELRHWTVPSTPPPENTVPVIMQLRQLPGQSWAKLTVRTAGNIDVAALPIQLDWDRLTPDTRSPEEVLATLERPAPTIPQRIVEEAHIGFWDRTFITPGVADALRGSADDLYLALNKSQRNWGQMPGAQYDRTYRPVSTDGRLPIGLSEATVKAFDARLEAYAQHIKSNVAKGHVFSSNREFLAITWAFTRCPEAIQEMIVAAIESLSLDDNNLFHEHPLMTLPLASKIVPHGAGRAVDGLSKLRRLFKALTGMKKPNASSRPAFAYSLSRREDAPKALDEQLIQRISKQLISELKSESVFAQNYKYNLLTLSGLLRVREEIPFAFVIGAHGSGRTAGIAEALHYELSSALKRMTKANIASQAPLKRQLTSDLMEHLEGKGDPNILHRIDALKDS